MFGSFKKKLKDVVSKFSKKVEEEGKKEEQPIEKLEEQLSEETKEKKEEIFEKEETKEEKPKKEKKKKFKKTIEDIHKDEIILAESEEIEEPEKEVIEEKPLEEKKGLFSKLKERIETRKINDKQFEDMFFDLEMVLLENNVAVEVIEKIKEGLKMDVVDVAINKKEINDKIFESLKESFEELFNIESEDLIKKVKSKENKPFSIVFIGINGSGKTTTIAKVAHLLKENNLKCCLVAADTFRAASIEQLEEHGKRLNIKVIKHDYKSDPAAVAFDGIKYAKSHSLDCVLIDTAGRLHSNINLMDEMKKIIRVTKPDMKIFVGEAITGNDAVEQAKKFNDTVGIDNVILSKMDVDDKGGAAVSISFITGKPISYIGTGQEYDKLEKFNSDKIMKQLGF